MRFLVLYGRRELRRRYADLGLLKSVPLDILKSHEEQAQKNHGQSLKELARRGGLCPQEMAAVLSDESWREARSRSAEDAVGVILAAIAAPDSQS